MGREWEIYFREKWGSPAQMGLDVSQGEGWALLSSGWKKIWIQVLRVVDKGYEQWTLVQFMVANFKS